MSTEPVEVFESDPFDPEVVRAAENVAHEKTVELDETLAAYIRRRGQAYKRVFANPDVAEDMAIVMQDLAAFCRAYEPTFDLNQKMQDLKEGRREVYNRIVDYTRLSHDDLYLKYTDAKLRMERK